MSTSKVSSRHETHPQKNHATLRGAFFSSGARRRGWSSLRIGGQLVLHKLRQAFLTACDSSSNAPCNDFYQNALDGFCSDARTSAGIPPVFSWFVCIELPTSTTMRQLSLFHDHGFVLRDRHARRDPNERLARRIGRRRARLDFARNGYFTNAYPHGSPEHEGYRSFTDNCATSNATHPPV